MQKIKLTERALLARINRKLSKDCHKVLTCRENSRWYSDLGRFYEVDLARNSHAGAHIDLEAYGKELGVLRPYEALN